jgi:hypothetical protein
LALFSRWLFLRITTIRFVSFCHFWLCKERGYQFIGVGLPIISGAWHSHDTSFFI